jgi:protein phosphatase 1 regulatory subunit 7
MEYLHVIGTMGPKVTVMEGLDNLPQLKELVLRSCLISKMQNLENLPSLDKLELYDNQITALENLEHLGHLRVLDMSFNLIKEMGNVRCCPNTEEIYLAQNKIKTIRGFSSSQRNENEDEDEEGGKEEDGKVNEADRPFRKLRVLDLGANRIRSLEGLEVCDQLVDLWMGKNKISSLHQPTLSALAPNLRRLDLQSNRLVDVSPLTVLSGLRELILAFNGIESVDCFFEKSSEEEGEGSPVFPNLTSLDLNHNNIRSLPSLTMQEEGEEGEEGRKRRVPLPLVEELILSSNSELQLETVEAFAPLVPSANFVSLQHTQAASDFEYRKRMTVAFQLLEDLDFLPVHRN